MRKIRLNESQFNRLVSKCVKKVLNESHGEPEPYLCTMLDATLDDYEAEEIAKDVNLDGPDEGARWYFEGIIGDCGESKSWCPKYSRFVCDIFGGYKLYRDYGAGYYFVINEDGINESRSSRLNKIR